MVQGWSCTKIFNALVFERPANFQDISMKISHLLEALPDEFTVMQSHSHESYVILKLLSRSKLFLPESRVILDPIACF